MLNKNIPISIAILTIAVVAAVAGGVSYWQYREVKNTKILENKVGEEDMEATEERNFSYPKDYILQEEELPFDFKYAQSLEGTEMGSYLDTNPGYADIHYQPGEGPEKTYCGVLFSEEKASPVVLCVFKMHSKKELEDFKEESNAMEAFENKSLLLDDDEKILMSILVDESTVGSEKTLEEKNWVEVVNGFGDRIEQKTDLNRISLISQEDKEKAEEYMGEALNRLEEIDRIEKSDDGGEEGRSQAQSEKTQITNLIREAVSLSKKSVELNPKNPELWFKRGNIYFELRDIEGAEDIIIRCY